MGKLRSFRDVIQDYFYNEIFEELSTYIEDNPSKLESRSHSVEDPDEASLDYFDVKRINITSSPDNRLYFDVIVSADIIIAETVKRNREIDGVDQWFRVSCTTVLEDGLRDFNVTDVSIYNKYRESQENRLSEYLVPVISKSQLETEAEKFLRKYYPEALTKPMPVPAREVTRRMGLDIQEIHITKTCSIFGQIYFSDCEVPYYDNESWAYKLMEISRGTILVDPNVFFMRSIGSVNNTIIHECVHWDLHRKFFELEKLYNDQARAISCWVQEGSRPESHRTPMDWMEWHANALAPRILMPAEQTKQKIAELIAKNERILPDANTADIMESVVFELSEYFQVSRIAAKIRMIDLGYPEAIGVYTYIDDRYIENHSFERSALKNNQTFSIGTQDTLYEYATNQEFRNLLDSGKYLYVDAHFCINDTKYIRRDADGYAQLTDYAKQHIDECCLIFDVTVQINNRFGVTYYTECVLFRDAASDKFIEVKFSSSVQNKATEARAEEFKRIGNEAKEIAGIVRRLPSTFGETLIAHMDRLDCTEEDLAEKSLISAKTIQRMRNEIRYKPKLETVVAVCIGMQLYPELSLDLIGKSGFSLKPFDEEHIIFRVLLCTKYQCSIFECNEILRINSCKPLGTKE